MITLNELSGVFYDYRIVNYQTGEVLIDPKSDYRLIQWLDWGVIIECFWHSSNQIDVTIISKEG